MTSLKNYSLLSSFISALFYERNTSREAFLNIGNPLQFSKVYCDDKNEALEVGEIAKCSPTATETVKTKFTFNKFYFKFQLSYFSFYPRSLPFWKTSHFYICLTPGPEHIITFFCFTKIMIVFNSQVFPCFICNNK